jgi:lipopolysaccharide transport system permease protein
VNVAEAEPLNRLARPESNPSGSDTPLHPLVTITGGTSGARLDLLLREVWNYHELLYFLTWRDVTVRYKQTLLGIAWAVLQPLLSMLIFTLFLGKWAKIPSDGIPYPLFIYAGLLPWMFFSNAITSSGNSLVGSAHLISKVYFPRVIIPTAAALAGLVDFGIAFALLGAMMLYYGLHAIAAWLFLPFLVVLTAVLAIGVGLLFSALNVKYRDVRYALPFLMQVWMFASPVVYPSTLVPEKWRLVFAINPMSGLIAGYRAALFGQHLELGSLGISLLVTFGILVYSLHTFRRAEKNFADIV